MFFCDAVSGGHTTHWKPAAPMPSVSNYDYRELIANIETGADESTNALADEAGSTWSPWGEAMDREAAKQLGLDETHTIVMMATEVDYLEDAREVISEFKDVGLCSAEEVVEAIEEKTIRVPLPRGMVLVAMAPIGKAEPRTYGLVTVTPNADVTDLAPGKEEK